MDNLTVSREERIMKAGERFDSCEVSVFGGTCAEVTHWDVYAVAIMWHGHLSVECSDCPDTLIAWLEGFSHD